jgi:hypothetical protein
MAKPVKYFTKQDYLDGKCDENGCAIPQEVLAAAEEANQTQTQTEAPDTNPPKTETKTKPEKTKPAAPRSQPRTKKD